MDYEKKYKESLERARNIHNEHKAQPFNIMTKVFPELAESEDESIRKALIDGFTVMKESKNCGKTFSNHNIPVEDILNWLEKQGGSIKEHNVCETCDEQASCVNPCPMKLVEEQKPADKEVEPKFHKGDWVFIEEVKGHKNGPFQIKNVDSFGYSFDEYHTIPFIYEDLLSKWTIQDAKDGDVLFQDLMGGKTFIYNGINHDMAILYSFIINNDGEDVLPYHIGKPNTGIGYVEENKNIIHPATKEQRELLFQKMKEAGYEWDAEKLELRKIEQELINIVQNKPWSEEDENIRLRLIDYIYGNSRLSKDREDGLNWLKSLKDRVVPQQKQEWSEEDENKLLCICAWIKDYPRIADFKDEMYTVANNYIDWLKSLRPQSQWKPSTFHLECIIDAISMYEERGINAIGLKEILEELKKLKS